MPAIARRGHLDLRGGRGLGQKPRQERPLRGCACAPAARAAAPRVDRGRSGGRQTDTTGGPAPRRARLVSVAGNQADLFGQGAQLLLDNWAAGSGDLAKRQQQLCEQAEGGWPADEPLFAASRGLVPGSGGAEAGSAAATRKPADETTAIEFQGVDFAYPTRPDVPVLSDFHLRVARGQTVSQPASQRPASHSCLALLRL